MEVKGRVLGEVRESSFDSKKRGEEGKKITMLYFDLYDVTAKLVSCEMVKDSTPLHEESKVIAEVVRWKESNFQNGPLIFSLRNVRIWVEDVPLSVPPPAPAAPAPVVVPAAGASAVETPARRPAPPR